MTRRRGFHVWRNRSNIQSSEKTSTTVTGTGESDPDTEIELEYTTYHAVLDVGLLVCFFGIIFFLVKSFLHRSIEESAEKSANFGKKVKGKHRRKARLIDVDAMSDESQKKK